MEKDSEARAIVLLGYISGSSNLHRVTRRLQYNLQARRLQREREVC